MIARALAVLTVVTSVAHAEVKGEASVGAGGETGGGGYAVARARLEARLVRAAPPRLERGLHFCGEDEPGAAAPANAEPGEKEPSCVWILTGLEPDQIDGVGLTLETSMRASREGDLDDGLALGGQAWAAGSGWRLGVRADVQPEGGLRDPFWRSGRGIVQRDVRLDVPPMWALGTERHQLTVAGGHVALGARTAYGGGAWQHAGFDRDIAFLGFGLHGPRLAFDLFEFRYLEYGVETEQYQGTTYGTSATVLEVDLARARVRLGPSLALEARGGMALHAPIAPFETRGTSEVSEGPTSLAPSYWLEARHTDGDLTAALGGGSWTRLDPSGHAVDHGQLAVASAAFAGQRLQLRAAAQLGHLRRILVGDLAPDTIAPVGTRAWMGRGSLEVAAPLSPSILLGATSWLERSDRDDPRWIAPSTGRVETRAGADVSAVWRFERKRRAPAAPPAAAGPPAVALRPR